MYKIRVTCKNIRASKICKTFATIFVDKFSQSNYYLLQYIYFFRRFLFVFSEIQKLISATRLVFYEFMELI